MGVNTNTGSGGSTTDDSPTDDSPTDVTITGTTGNDVLTIDTNTTSVWAGSGTDTVVFSGDFSNYSVSYSDSFVPLITHTTTNQLVSLYGVEEIKFGESLYAFPVNRDGEFRINTTSLYSQANPDIAVFSNGGFVAVWDGYIAEENSREVVAQIYDSNGNAIGSEFKVNSYSSNGGQINPSVVVLDDDSFVITWQSQYQYSGLDVVAKRYDVDGQAVFGTEFRVNTSSSSGLPNIAKLNDGGFVIGFYGAGNYTDNILFQRYDSDGVTVGSEVIVDSVPRAADYNINVIVLENQSFVISWTDGSDNIKAKIYAADGNEISNTFTIAYTHLSSSYSFQNQSIISTSDGGFVVVSSSSEVVDGFGTDRGIFAQRYDENGNEVGGKFQVNTYVLNSQIKPGIASVNNDGFVIAWQSDGQDGDEGGIFAQRYDASGNTVGGEFQVNTHYTETQNNLKISETSDGGFIITWQSYFQDVSDYGIYAQRYDSDGNSFGEASIHTLDKLTGTTNDDILQGDDGIDYISTLEGADLVRAEMGDDIVTLAADGVWDSGYAAENMSYSVWVGTGEKVVLTGYNQFNDVVYGGGDVDTIVLTDGSDAFFLDNIYTAHHSSLTLSSTTRGVDSTARIEGIEVIYAGEGNDIVDLTSDNFNLIEAITIHGEAGNDILWGSTGIDTINGGTGNDVINGGAGSDILTGGSGADEFQFTASSAADIVTDFNITEDSIKLYYRAEDKHTYDDISILNGVLSWDASDYFTTPVSIDLSSRIVSSDLSNIPDLSITFVEIV